MDRIKIKSPYYLKYLFILFEGEHNYNAIENYETNNAYTQRATIQQQRWNTILRLYLSKYRTKIFIKSRELFRTEGHTDWDT